MVDTFLVLNILWTCDCVHSVPLFLPNLQLNEPKQNDIMNVELRENWRFWRPVVVVYPNWLFTLRRSQCCDLRTICIIKDNNNWDLRNHSFMRHESRYKSRYNVLKKKVHFHLHTTVAIKQSSTIPKRKNANFVTSVYPCLLPRATPCVFLFAHHGGPVQ